MRFLKSLCEGDKFRPAHPGQVSLNRRPMSRDQVYEITRVYSQSPYMTIAVTREDPTSFYSLGPSTPVLLPREPNPTLAEITKFLAPMGVKKVVAYKLLWDGQVDLTKVATPHAVAILRVMFVFGKEIYGRSELNQLLVENLHKFLDSPTKFDVQQILPRYRRYLTDRGLIEEIIDEAPATEAVREANLQGVIT